MAMMMLTTTIYIIWRMQAEGGAAVEGGGDANIRAGEERARGG